MEGSWKDTGKNKRHVHTPTLNSKRVLASFRWFHLSPCDLRNQTFQLFIICLKKKKKKSLNLETQNYRAGHVSQTYERGMDK